MLWEELNRVALLGTARSALSEEALEKLKNYGIAEAADTTILLEAAALLAQFRKVQPPLTQFEGNRPTPIEVRDTRYISSISSKHFEQLLKFHPLALEEFSVHLQEYELYLSPELCPLALEAVRIDRLNWDAIASITPPEGWWVIGKNEDWAKWKNAPFKQVERPYAKIKEATHFVLDLQEQIVAGRTFLEGYNWQELIRNIYWFDLSAYHDFQQGWQLGNRISYEWIHRMEKVTNILDFRKEMVVEIEKTGSE